MMRHCVVKGGRVARFVYAKYSIAARTDGVT